MKGKEIKKKNGVNLVEKIDNLFIWGWNKPEPTNSDNFPYSPPLTPSPSTTSFSHTTSQGNFSSKVSESKLSRDLQELGIDAN